MRATLEDKTTVHYLMTRALSRPQTPWPGRLWAVGDEGALAWDGAGPVLHHRSLPTHDYRDQHLGIGEVSYVNRDTRNTAAPPALFGNSTMSMVRELVSAINEGRPHLNSIDENWISFATAMAAVESANTGQPIAVPAV
jgi:predicted dehydrogenase